MIETKTIAEPGPGQVQEIIDRHRGQKWALIPLLQKIQEAFGYIPAGAVRPIAASLGLFPSQVQGVITFYSQFYTTPRGQHIVRVCRGTACHVRGSKTILKLARQRLGIKENETTPDYKYSLETVACIGCCALAPNMVVGNTIYGKLNPKKLTAIFDQYEER
ncbi:MAG: NADH-quinone oxidoreductase subunit NuoE [Chloroflexota bacterium]